MKKILLYLGFTFLFFSVVLFFLSNSSPKIKINAITQPAAVSAMAENAPAVKTFNILLIPGHEPKDGGGNYKNVYERDLAVDIADKISEILTQDPKYKVIIARDKNDWNPTLKDYFENEKQNIIDWKTQCQKDNDALMLSGKIKPVPDMAFHSDATPEMSVRLYGMNKWANENGIDLVLNLHFNDSIRPNMNLPGLFKGFDIFVPESQLKNSVASHLAANEISNELKKVEPPEVNHLLEDQTLIALGASGTLNAPSMLIEYAYIYEKQLPVLQMAQQTALGIENYVSKTPQTAN
ncbi:MAG: N-acetylmuramoyl-L-alanine amidase [Candidatus Staskawiczbacteria bacterium]|nr:N-acetylmuramoyl-L-alanine amidase [Candidatus Staskawiczbacteria bacterium]